MPSTALHDWHRDHGAKLVDFAGWEMPMWYRSITEEHTAVRMRAGLFDIAHMGRLRFEGTDAVRLLDTIVTNNVSAMPVGQVRYALVCNEMGGILDDVLVYAFEDHHLLVVNASNREKIVAWIQNRIGEFDATMTDQTHDRFMLALQGPKAVSILSRVVDDSVADLKYYTGREVSHDLGPLTITRTGYTGEDGFEVICPSEHAVKLWGTLLEAGAEDDILPCGLGCRDTLRLEAAMPLYGHEMDEQTNPVQAGLMFGVKLSKPDFIGKAAIEEAKAGADSLVRVGFELEGKRIAREGARVLVDEIGVGEITSGTFAPGLGKAIAMGYVPSGHAEPGTTVTLDVRGKPVAAKVVPLPFYRRAK